MKTIESLYSRIIKLPLFLVILISCISLGGWIIGKIIIASVSMRFIPMAPSTGFYFLILGLSLFIVKNYSHIRFSRGIVLSLLTITLIFCVIILCEFFFSLNFDIENIFIANPANFDKVTIGRMSPITAFLFSTSCIGIWGKLKSDSGVANYIGGSSATLTTILASILLIGYLYNAPLLYGHEIIPVALLTAICFLLLGISLIQSYDIKYWTFKLFRNNQIQLRLLSTFMPLAIFMIVFQGFLEINFSDKQKNPTLTTALTLLVIISITIFIVSKASAFLSKRLSEAENALKKQTMFLDKVIENTAVSTIITDDTGTAIRANPACLELFGVKDSQLIGIYNIFKDRVIEEKGFMPVIHDVFNKAKYANIIIDYDFALVDQVGLESASHKIVNSIFTPVTDETGKVTNVIVQTIDLSEIKTVQENAIKERNKAEQYLDIAGVMLVSLDIDGTVQLINPKGCEILGYSKDEILGKNWFENFLPDDEIDNVKKVGEKAYSGKFEEVQYVENKIRTKSGELRLIAWRNALLNDSNNNIVGLLSSGEDITERKIAEKQLIDAKELAEESEKQLKLIADNFVNGMIYQVAMLDEDKRKFTYLSDAVYKLYGCTFEEAMQNPDLIYGRIYEDDIADLIAKEKEALRNMSVFETEARVINPDGSIRWAYYVSQPRIINGIVHWDGIEVDFTERKKTEEELINARRKAEESDRLKTTFLQNMSHEIRTPMNSIMGFASLLPEEENKETLVNYSDIIYKNAEQLVRVIDDIVLFSQLQSKQMRMFSKKFDLLSLLKEVKVSFNIPEYQKGVELVIDLQTSDPLMVVTDNEKLWQIYANLISNAFKYTKKGQISFGAYNRENDTLCFVKDTGIGIPKQEIPKIFERFFRASNVDKGDIGGTGLGLSIVHELVHLLGGTIWVESNIGKGTEFYFTIPFRNLPHE